MSLLSAILVLLQKRALMSNALWARDARCAVMDDRDVYVLQTVRQRVSGTVGRFVGQMNVPTGTTVQC